MPKMLNIPEAENAKEAAALILGGVFYFVMKKPLITIPIILILGFFPAIKAYEYFNTEQVVVKKAKPAKMVVDDSEDTGANWSIMSQAYAGKPAKPCADSIVIDGVFYGCNDTTLQAYALLGTDRWIIHDHVVKEVLDVEFPYIREQRKQQQKK